MAYMYQELKAKIAVEVKAVAPAGWKYSLSVRNLQEIVMTVKAAPDDLITALEPVCGRVNCCGVLTVNQYIVDRIADEGLRATMKAVFGALNKFNYNRSDSQSDYFDVGYYVDLRIGSEKTPFTVK